MGIGDEIMTSGIARRMQLSDPRKVRPLYQGKPRWHSIWDGNPRIAKPDEKGDFQILHARDLANNRPYHTKKTDERWTYNPDFRAEPGEIYLTSEERAFGLKYAGRIILEPHIKSNASPNKSWGWVRWNKLAYLLQKAGYRVTQLGPQGTKLLDEHVEHIVTPNFRLAAAVIGQARVCALPEGGGHHAAAAFNTPAVVIFGGFTPIELTGYECHVNIGASFADACGMRIPCKHCADWMASIKPEVVFNELENILGRFSGSGRRASAENGTSPSRHDAGAEVAEGRWQAHVSV